MSPAVHADLHSKPTRDEVVVATLAEPVVAIDIPTHVFIEGLATETAVRMVRSHLERAVRIVQNAGTQVELGSSPRSTDASGYRQLVAGPPTAEHNNVSVCDFRRALNSGFKGCS